MKKSLSRAIAIAAVCTTGFAGALATTTTAEAGQSKAAKASESKVTKTDFAYEGDVFGAKVLVDGIELRTLKQSYAQQRCTTLAGKEIVEQGLVSLPENDLLQASLVKSTTETFRRVEAGKVVHGVTGNAKVGDILVNLTDEGTPAVDELPTLSLTGLTSTAEVWHDGKAFQHRESFTAPTLKLGNLPEQIPAELQALIDELGGLVGELTQPVIDLISELGTITIPELGTIGVFGKKVGRASATDAVSETSTLLVQIDKIPGITENKTSLELGRARVRMAKPVPAGVFRSTATGIRMNILKGALELGTLGQRSVPCEGTNGKMVTQKIASANIAAGLGLVQLTGVEYGIMGLQKKNGFAKSKIVSNLGSLEVPSVGLVVEGIQSALTLVKPAGTKKVQKTVETSVARITLNGEELALPTRPGQEIDLGDGNILRYRVLTKSNFRGAELNAVQLVLPGFGLPEGAEVALGWAAGSIYTR